MFDPTNDELVQRFRSSANWELIPEHCRAGLDRYISFGTLPGDFLQAIISNDLRGAVRLADPINLSRIADYVKFLHSHAPSLCWGSPEIMQAWSLLGGLSLRDKAA